MSILEKLKSLEVPGPTITAVTKPFWDGAARRELLIQQCSDCKKYVFYPRTHCPHCWSNNLDWKAASGKAQLKTYSIVHRPGGHPGWQAIAPYPVAVVELEEGPSMMTQILTDAPESLKMGDQLRVKFVEVNNNWLPFFESDN